jgi:hypothetical protein
VTPLFLNRIERLPDIADSARALHEWHCLTARARYRARAEQMRRDAGLPEWTGGK